MVNKRRKTLLAEIFLPNSSLSKKTMQTSPILLLLLFAFCVSAETILATVYYTGSSYKLVPNVRDWNGAAVVTYNKTLEQTGWDNLFIWTNSSYLDFVQGYAAGYAEGFVTSKRIASHYSNLKQNMFGTKAIPNSVLNWFTQNKQVKKCDGNY